MAKQSAHGKGYQDGYRKGSSGEPHSQAYQMLDFLNIFDPDQQKYEDGLEKGYDHGSSDRQSSSGSSSSGGGSGK